MVERGLASGISAGAGGWLLGSRPACDLALRSCVSSAGDPAVRNEPGLGPCRTGSTFSAAKLLAVMGQQTALALLPFSLHLHWPLNGEAGGGRGYLRSTRGQSWKMVGFNPELGSPAGRHLQRFLRDAGVRCSH